MNMKTISYKQITFRVQNTKDKKKILEKPEGKKCTLLTKYEKKVWITADFWSETMETESGVKYVK